MSYRDDLINIVERTKLLPAGSVVPYVPPNLSSFREFAASVSINRLILNPQTPGGQYDPRGEITWLLTVFGRSRRSLEAITDQLPFVLIRRGDHVGESGLTIYSTVLENMLVEPSDESQSSWIAICRFRSVVEFPY